ncbi:SH3 domain-containing protein [Flexibacterium corallicola]|uniref:SH3 domain-containing protein n=1 Tax=Flexibacterium corallicola TaxID=3037259 RepID=UPI00286EF634|nr:SH3 domain-containing protein [Pseudovibrio sp. M1P-2-3]
MRTFRHLLITSLILFTFFASEVFAWPARTTQPLNFRTGPSLDDEVVLIIPYGNYLEVRGCLSWCLVVYAGRNGWVSSNYIAPLEGGPPPIVTAPPVTNPPYWGFPVFTRRRPLAQPTPPAGLPVEELSAWERMRRSLDW